MEDGAQLTPSTSCTSLPYQEPVCVWQLLSGQGSTLYQRSPARQSRVPPTRLGIPLPPTLTGETHSHRVADVSFDGYSPTEEVPGAAGQARVGTWKHLELLSISPANGWCQQHHRDHRDHSNRHWECFGHSNTWHVWHIKSHSLELDRIWWKCCCVFKTSLARLMTTVYVDTARETNLFTKMSASKHWSGTSVGGGHEREAIVHMFTDPEIQLLSSRPRNHAGLCFKRRKTLISSSRPRHRESRRQRQCH